MKVRVGFGLGTSGLADLGRFADVVDGLEGLGFDSLWLSERVGGGAPDPLVGLAFAAGRTRRLKLGTSVQVLPGRNPVLVAQAWASLDALSGGRALPAFGLGAVDPHEQRAFAVRREQRGPLFDEALELVRRLWTEDVVDHHGARFDFEQVSVRPRPVQQPLDVWLGGVAPSELRRVGRLGDGWLPSFCTPEDVAAARRVVEEAAATAGRAIDPEHYGALVVYGGGPVPERVLAALRRRRPHLEDPAEVIPPDHRALVDRVEAFCAVGCSKFVVAPLAEPADWAAELEALAAAVLPRQRG